MYHPMCEWLPHLMHALQILLGNEASQKPVMPALEERDEAFFTEGPDELKAARLWILDYSLPRCTPPHTTIQNNAKLRGDIII